MGLRHIMLKAFPLTNGLLLADIANQQSIQECAAQPFFRLAHGLEFCHLQPAGRCPMLGHQQKVTATGIVLGRISNLRVEANPSAAQMAEGNRGQLTGGLFQEMAQSAQIYARTKLKVKTNPTLARSALGFEPVAPKGKAESKK